MRLRRSCTIYLPWDGLLQTDSQLPRNTRKVKVRRHSCSEKSRCFKENLNGRTIQKSNIALRVITSSFKHFPKDWRKIHTLKVLNLCERQLSYRSAPSPGEGRSTCRSEWYKIPATFKRTAMLSESSRAKILFPTFFPRVSYACLLLCILVLQRLHWLRQSSH